MANCAIDSCDEQSLSFCACNKNTPTKDIIETVVVSLSLVVVKDGKVFGEETLCKLERPAWTLSRMEKCKRYQDILSNARQHATCTNNTLHSESFSLPRNCTVGPFLSGHTLLCELNHCVRPPQTGLYCVLTSSLATHSFPACRYKS